jgi:hypothetical protein
MGNAKRTIWIVWQKDLPDAKLIPNDNIRIFIPIVEVP